MPFEIIGDIAELSGSECVNRLFCCGSKKLNFRLMSEYGIRVVYKNSRTQMLNRGFPYFATHLKGLESLILVTKHRNGIFPHVSQRTLLTLPPTLKSIRFEFLNAELCWLTDFTLGKDGHIQSFRLPTKFNFAERFPNLHTLELDGDIRNLNIMSCKRRVACLDLLLSFALPPSLTRLLLNTMLSNQFFKLPLSLQYLEVRHARRLAFGVWLSRLTELRSLILPNWRWNSIEEQFLVLPSTLTRLVIENYAVTASETNLSSLSLLSSDIQHFESTNLTAPEGVAHFSRGLTNLSLTTTVADGSLFSQLPRVLTRLHLLVPRSYSDIPSFDLKLLPPTLQALEIPSIMLCVDKIIFLPSTLTFLSLDQLGGLPFEFRQMSDIIEQSLPNWRTLVQHNAFCEPDAEFRRNLPKTLTYLHYPNYHQSEWWRLDGWNSEWLTQQHGWASLETATKFDDSPMLAFLMHRSRCEWKLMSHMLKEAVRNGSERVLQWLEEDGFDFMFHSQNNPVQLFAIALEEKQVLIARMMIAKWAKWFPLELYDYPGPEERLMDEEDLWDRFDDGMIENNTTWPDDGFYDGCHRSPSFSRERHFDSQSETTKMIFALSASLGLADVLEWLVVEHKLTYQLQGRFVTSMMKTASSKGHWGVFKWIYTHMKGEIDYELIEAAIMWKNLEILEWMKERGVSIFSILQQHSKHTIRDWIRSSSLPVLKWLKKIGCSLGSPGGLAHLICQYVPSPDIAKWLHSTFQLSFDEPDPSDLDRVYPLHIVSRTANVPMLRFLYTIGANMHPVDARGNTPYDIAKKRNISKSITFFEQVEAFEAKKAQNQTANTTEGDEHCSSPST